MPIEELLALYRSNMPNNVTSTVDDDELERAEDDERNEECDALGANSESTSQSEMNDKQTKSQMEQDELIAKLDPLPASSNLSRLISPSEDAFFDISDDEEEDEEDTPEDNYRRTIQVGLDYQAAIPDSTIKEELNIVNNSLLLWNPKQIDELDVENYLGNFASSDAADLTNQLDHRDELALYVLLKNNYDIDNALNNRNNLEKEQIDLFTFIKPWSDEECDLFEDGLRAHGKDFHLVQKNKLPNKTVNELVNFYYLWKKTERHDTFTSKFKFEKKKYSLNPMTTDLMDHFLDDHQQQQTNQSFNSTSSSLNNSQNNMIVHKQSSTSPITLLPQSADQSNVNRVTTTNHSVEQSNLTNTEINPLIELKSDPNISNNLSYSNEDSSSNQSSSLVINEINSNEDDSCLTKTNLTSATAANDCPNTVSESTSNLENVTSLEM